jgi:hypothetical protein
MLLCALLLCAGGLAYLLATDPTPESDQPSALGATRRPPGVRIDRSERSCVSVTEVFSSQQGGDIVVEGAFHATMPATPNGPVGIVVLLLARDGRRLAPRVVIHADPVRSKHRFSVRFRASQETQIRIEDLGARC